MWHFVWLIACAVAIYLSCEWFVNAVEWLGHRMNIGRMAVGTVLAAFGTALPESVVTLVAVVFGTTPAQKDIGVGAAMGGPLALATVAYGVTGLMLLLKRRGTGNGGGALADAAENARLARDQRWFLVVFIVKVGLGLVAFAFKPVLGLFFLATYAVYFWREIRAESPEGSDSGTGSGPGSDPDSQVEAAEDGEELELEPLKLQPKAANPATWAVLTQTLVTLVVIFIASQLFVHQLDAIGPMIGLPAAVTALLLSPIATELPEVMNAIIWVRQGKTKLALANISGAMMIQATVPSALGLLFTPWLFDSAVVWSGLVTMAAIVYLLATLRANRLTPTRLAWAGAFYLVFAAGLFYLL